MGERLRVQPPANRTRVAFLFGIPIAMGGGLIGLGGAEFRLPVLAGPLQVPIRSLVPTNLAISLATILVAASIRVFSISSQDLDSHVVEIACICGGGLAAAYITPVFASRLDEAWTSRMMLLLLLGVGSALIAEAFLPDDSRSAVPDVVPLQIIVAIGMGLVIGIFSSLLGVAGGELIIPSLVFGFGADIKTAGTASLLISAPIVMMGIIRYARQPTVSTDMSVVTPMALGSAIGAVIGALSAGIVSPRVLKFILGLVLISSALHVFGSTRTKQRKT